MTSVSHTFIGVATDVHTALGPGYPKEVYVNALRSELAEKGISTEPGKTLEVMHKGRRMGEVTADLVVDGKFIVSVMASPVEIGSYERAELRAQLRAADMVLGLIVNFAGRRLKDGLVRVLNPDKLKPLGEPGDGAEAEAHGERDWGHEEQG